MSNSVQKLAPGPKGLPIIGNMREMQKSGILDFYRGLWRDYGDVVRVEMGPMTIHQFVRPEHVQYILVRRRDNFIKGLSHDKLRVPLGYGILTAEGDLWRNQRKLMAPTYTRRGVEDFAGVMTSETAQMLKRWDSLHDGDVISINQEMMRLTMSVISVSMFNIDIGEDFADAGEALTFILEFANKRTISLIDPPMFIPTPMNRKLKRSLQTIDNFLYNIIAERRSQLAGDDLLSILMHAQDEQTGETMSDKQLRDEVLITFFAGHETTAQLLTWTWFLLSKHPHVEERFHQELEEALGGETPGVEDIEKLTYTRMIMDETLRLYSPVAITARDAVEEDNVEGYPIPAGSMVTLSPFITHRHPEFWDRPDDFYPEHFTEQSVNARPRYAYYPFGAGPRICLGMHFALLEGALVLGEVGQRYRFELVPGQDIQPQWSGTLRPDRDVLVRLFRR